MKKLLIVVDMQNDFVTGSLGSPAAQPVVEPIAWKVAEYQRQGHPVLFTQDTHHAADYQGDHQTEESRRIPRHCIQGTPGWELVPILASLAEKGGSRKSTFLSTTLAEEIRQVYGDQVALELCGVCTDICVVSNALMLRAEFPHSPISVDAACCAGTSPENHTAALAVMSSCLVDIL